MGNGTSIGRVRGLGSAHSGAQTWLSERFTGIASLLVSGYFLVSLLLLPSLNYLTVRAWTKLTMTNSAITVAGTGLVIHARTVR